MEEKTKIKKPLKRSLILGSVFTVVILCLTVESIGISIFRGTIQSNYETYIQDLLNFTMTAIDADDLEQCIETLTPSEKYNKLQKLLNTIKETHEIDSIYIILPLSTEKKDNMMNIMAGVSEYERNNMPENITHLGKLTGETYPPETVSLYQSGMNRRKRVTFFRTNFKKFNDSYIGVKPILNSRGIPIALLCVDIAMSELKNSIADFALLNLIGLILSSGILLFVIIRWLKKHIILPINALEESISNYAADAHDAKTSSELTLIKPEIIHSHDEIESLADSIVLMSEDLKTYMESMLNASSKVENLKKYINQVDELTFKDTLTSVKNKMAYEKAKKRLDWDIINHNAKLSLVMADLNYSKNINETYGHEYGDSYIQKACKMICNTFQHSPVYRIGGDEFLVITENEDLTNCKTLVETLKKEASITYNDNALQPWEKISLAIGVAYYNESLDSSIDDIFKRAHKEMIKDKALSKSL